MPTNPEDKLGALWQKTGAHGDYFSGEIELNGEKHRIVVFANQRKTAEKQPDWHIFRSVPRVPSHD